MKTVQRILWWYVLVLEVIIGVRHFVPGALGPPPPFETDSLAVLFLIDSDPNATLTPEQDSIVNGTSAGSVAEWCNKNCGKMPDGSLKFRSIGKGTDAKTADKWVQSAYEAFKDSSPPAIIVSNGKSGFGPEPLAKNTEEELKRLAPFGAKP